MSAPTSGWTNCWICERTFGRVRPTVRQCATCQLAFCEGEHGMYSTSSGGRCLRCALAPVAALGDPPSDALPLLLPPAEPPPTDG